MTEDRSSPQLVILFNLVGNAVKFTDHGEIQVVARQVQEEGRSQLQFDVIDTGIGIPEDKIARLFGRFTQLDGGAIGDLAVRGWGWSSVSGLPFSWGEGLRSRVVRGKGVVFD